MSFLPEVPYHGALYVKARIGELRGTKLLNFERHRPSRDDEMVMFPKTANSWLNHHKLKKALFRSGSLDGKLLDCTLNQRDRRAPLLRPHPTRRTRRLCAPFRCASRLPLFRSLNSPEIGCRRTNWAKPARRSNKTRRRKRAQLASLELHKPQRPWTLHFFARNFSKTFKRWTRSVHPASSIAR